MLFPFKKMVALPLAMFTGGCPASPNRSPSVCYQVSGMIPAYSAIGPADKRCAGCILTKFSSKYRPNIQKHLPVYLWFSPCHMHSYAAIFCPKPSNSWANDGTSFHHVGWVVSPKQPSHINCLGLPTEMPPGPLDLVMHPGLIPTTWRARGPISGCLNDD